jgi:nucleotide-binding universal stress UspA family protein
MLAIQCILHPTDFSPTSDAAFRIACSLAREYGARLIVLHTFQPPVVVPSGIEPIPLTTPADRAALEAQLRQMRPPDPGVRIEYRLVEGDPAKTILEVCREAHCDLIAMGTHGRTGLGRLLIGSVAEKVVRNAPCPVLAVKTPHPKQS